jgi:pyruvate,water dikinase
VKESYIGAKRLKTVLDAEGIRETPVARSEQMVLCLDEPKVREITRLAVQLESRMGWPVDLEFAYLADQLYVLQCRPITTL